MPNSRYMAHPPGSKTFFRPGVLTNPISLSELHVWTVLLAGVAYWGNIARNSGYDVSLSLTAVTQAVFARGAFTIAAWVMVVVWVKAVAPRGNASRRQIATAMAIGVLCMIPTRQTTIAALLMLGVVLARPSGTRHGRQVAALLICLAIEMVWTSIYLLPLHDAVATFDARAVQAVLSLAGQTVSVHGNVVINDPAQFSIEVLAYCASSSPLASVGLAFVVTSLYCGRLPGLADLPWLAGSLLASVALTELRLSLMVLSEPNYLRIHDGDGGTVYTFLALGLAMLFPLVAAYRAPATIERIA
jgi:hypothetical protein